MLELIYVDLANRNHENLLTFENFLLFFGLTGLWGAKLFRVFSGESRKLITKEEFFYGLCRCGGSQRGQRKHRTRRRSSSCSTSSRTRRTMALNSSTSPKW